MTKWNFNMDEAPRGNIVIRMVTTPKGIFPKEIYEPDPIIATDGEMVTLSRWHPPITDGPIGQQRAGRWSMFGVNQTPVAWMPWPLPPEKKDDSEV
jgi:hypothetical protein